MGYPLYKCIHKSNVLQTTNKYHSQQPLNMFTSRVKIIVSTALQSENIFQAFTMLQQKINDSAISDEKNWKTSGVSYIQKN